MSDIEEARRIINQSAQEVLAAVVAGFDAILRFLEALPKLPSWPGRMIVRCTAEAELLDWEMSDGIANWIAWQLPRRYVIGFVRMVRR